MSLILDGTNGLSDVDGSAATPAIRGTDANTGIFFGTDIIGFSEGGVEAMRINASGNLQTLATIGVGNATPSTSGAGVTFPATQSASSDANTLDDYEEGTFTPVLSPNAGSITTQSSYGYYTKVGNSVTVLVAISIANGGTASGVGTITGLPFTSQTVTSLFSGGNRSGTASFREDGNTGNWYFGYLLSNNTQMVVSSSTNGALSYTNSNCYVASFVYRTT